MNPQAATIQTVLVKRLHHYLLHNHPDLLVSLQEEGAVTAYLEERITVLEDFPEVLLAEGKPDYIEEEICLEALTRDLRPSRFNYLSLVVQEAFETEYYGWLESGIITYEVIHLVRECAPVFEQFGFSEATEDDEELRYAVIGKIQAYIGTNS